MSMANAPAVKPPTNPQRYFEHVGEQRSAVAETEPICLYLETTNRCNLLCTTCPRTFEALEPPTDMSWDLFTSLFNHCPGIALPLLHAAGEPIVVLDLPRMRRD